MFNDQHLATRSANFRPLTPLDLLERTVEVHGARPAVAWHDRTWDYTQFRQIVARMAHWLKAQGVGPGDVVSVMLTNRPEMLAAHFAVPALGAVLNALNTRLAGEEIGDKLLAAFGDVGHRLGNFPGVRKRTLGAWLIVHVNPFMITLGWLGA